jgi:cytochrome c oxidase subunit 2
VIRTLAGSCIGPRQHPSAVIRCETDILVSGSPVRMEQKINTLVICSERQRGFQGKEFNVNRLKMMLIGLTILSATSAGTVAQLAKDVGTGAQSVHEIQVTLRKYEFSPGTLRVRKGEQVKLVMVAADHDHGFKLDDFNIDQKIPKGTTVVVEFTADKIGSFQFRCSSVCGLAS